MVPFEGEDWRLLFGGVVCLRRDELVLIGISCPSE